MRKRSHRGRGEKITEVTESFAVYSVCCASLRELGVKPKSVCRNRTRLSNLIQDDKLDMEAKTFGAG